MTTQEAFWRGEFGDEYTERSKDMDQIEIQRNIITDMLYGEYDGEYGQGAPASVLELGANVGQNLMALRQIRADIQCAAVEINEKAAEQCSRNVPGAEVYVQSILEFKPARIWELVFTFGVLIHIPPDKLNQVYDLMHSASSKYILLAEYYNPTPQAIPYRGHLDRLWRRDFAGEMLDRFPDLSLLDYGFVYHRDKHCPADDVTWFLLSK